MFATGPIAFHTILSLIAIGTGGCVILAMSKGGRPGYCTLAFLISMIATDVTGFFLPAPKLLPSHIFGILSLVMIVIALAANYAFHFAGAWRAIYAVTMGIAIYLNFFVLVTQLFLKVGAACARPECAGHSRAAVRDRASDRVGDFHLADLEEREEFSR